jgi:phage head maturation protease
MFDTLRAAAAEEYDERAEAMGAKPYGDVKYADPGYQDDKTKRYPIDSEAHCRAAWSYINMPKNAAKYSPDELARIKGRIRAAGKKYGIEFSSPERSEEDYAELRRGDGLCTRSYEFEIRSVGDNGRSLEGHVAVFRSVARIPDRNGEFDEEIHPGVFDRYLGERGFPVMQFDHGKDPRTGTVPIGVYDVFEPDAKGYFVRGQLFDNHVVEPVRQAIEGRAIRGMSWRMHVVKNGDRWTRHFGGIDKRDILDADVPEAGPVVFPAYRDTAVVVRSLWAALDPEEQVEMRQVAGISTDLTGQQGTRSASGSDPDVKPGQGDTSSNAIYRARELDIALRPPIILPRRNP